MPFHCHNRTNSSTATAFVFKEVFEEYAYTPEQLTEPTPSHESQLFGSQSEHIDNAAIEIPLNTVIDAMNVFGTAGVSTSSNTSKYRTWRRADGNSDNEREDGQQNRHRAGNGRLDQYLAGPEKKTGMRISYRGNGYPITLLLYVYIKAFLTLALISSVERRRPA
jgi:cell cycle checkpoint protein